MTTSTLRRTALALPLIALSLAACGSDEATDTTETTASATAASAPATTMAPTTTAASTESTSPASPAGATVTVQTFQFGPDPVVVRAGTTITFVNNDKIDHTVTAGTREAPTPDVFDGQLPQQGATFDLTLTDPGTYDYFCEIHPGGGMTARIVVE
jgi:plastocyanin